MRIFTTRRPRGRPPYPDVVTPAEGRVLELLRAGSTNGEIASALGISVNTVKTHVSSMLTKLELRHRHELAVWRNEEPARSAPRRHGLALGPLFSTVVGRARETLVIIGGAGAAVAGVALLVIALPGANDGADTAGPEPPSAAQMTRTPDPEATAFVPNLVPGTFTIAHPDLIPRGFSTVTLLDDGRVLIAGGRHMVDNLDEYIADTELFDPATNIVSPGSPLATPRSHHRAALLDGGHVLLTGGVTRDLAPLATTEIYDPATDSFRDGPEMAYPRAAHAIVLLADGRVLVSGGNAEEAGATAEIYDPAGGRFTSTGDMNVSRAGHQLTLLLDGTVLVSGDGPLERYDPATGVFESLEITPPGLLPTATLLADGRVLLAGGSDRELLFQGPPNSHGGGPATAQLVIFDPDSQQLIDGGELLNERQDHAAARLADGRVLIAGGAQDAHFNEPFLAAAEIYDPQTGTSIPTSPMMQPRVYHSLTVLDDGTVLVIGVSGAPPGIAAERYTP